MGSSNNSAAFGAPGIEPRWNFEREGGSWPAYHTSCRLWFTLSHGIVNEIYYPHVDQPNTRDFQFLISDGESFCHEEKRDLNHHIEYPERDCVFYRLTNSEPNGRYRLIKHVLTDPHRSRAARSHQDRSRRPSAAPQAAPLCTAAPHIARYGGRNSGWCFELPDTS